MLIESEKIYLSMWVISFPEIAIHFHFRVVIDGRKWFLVISGVYLGVKWKLNLMENLCQKVQEIELENFRITAESGGLQISPKKNFPLVFDAVSFREKTKLGLIPTCCRGPKLIFQSVVKTWSN